MKKIFPLLLTLFMFLMPLNAKAAPSGYDKYGELADEVYEDEKELLAALVWAEAGNQDIYGKQLVVDVVLNRMNDPRFPNTIAEVIYQPGQFYSEGDSRLTRAFWNITPDCYQAVINETDGSISDSSVFFYCAGYFPQYGTPAYQYGDHYFNTY